MIPWKVLDSAAAPGSNDPLTLHQRGHEFSIRVQHMELMNSRRSASESGFSELGCARIAGRPRPRVLIGGLGMGFSLRRALDGLPANATVVVAELVPQVVTWNETVLGHLAGHPLRDPRVVVRQGDVAQLLRESRGAFDLIMLDVDNGPEGLTQAANDWLYARPGIETARAALRPQGVLGYWSAKPDARFVRRLERAGLAVEEHVLAAANGGRGTRHVVWLATARAEPSRAPARTRPARR